MAMKEDESQGKQAEDKRVFLGFGDDQGRGRGALIALQDSLSIWRTTLSMAACISLMLA